jgi:hypothetical protein
MKYCFVLLHHGLGMLADVVSSLPLSYELVIICDRCISSATAEEAASFGSAFEVLDTDVLTADLVMSTVKKCQPSASSFCISVWEGHRSIMSRVNEYLGATDLSETRVQLLRDKYQLRNALCNFGYSKARAELLTPSSYGAKASAEGDYFVKPRMGTGSFCATRLSDTTSYQDIVAQYRSMLQGSPLDGYAQAGADGLIVEDFIDGIEFSVEVVCLNGEPYVLAIQEKCCIEPVGGTVLEYSSMSPPIQVSSDDCARIARYVKGALRALGVDNGCYHYELRFDKSSKSCDTIEINPRNGGGYNSEVVRELHGFSLIEAWVSVLAAGDGAVNAGRLAEADERVTRGDGRISTIYWNYYLLPGKSYRGIHFRFDGPEPCLHIKLVDDDLDVPDVKMEFRAAQALWVVPKFKGGEDVAEFVEYMRAQLRFSALDGERDRSRDIRRPAGCADSQKRHL